MRIDIMTLFPDLIDGVMHTVNWRTGEVLDG